MPDDFFQLDNEEEVIQRLNANRERNVREFRERLENARRNIPNPVPAPQRRRNNVGQVLDTIGIELESLALSRDSAARVLSNLPNGLGNNFKVHRDGSSEINAYYVNPDANRNNNAIYISSHTPEAQNLFEGKQLKNTLGYELISIPMDIVTSDLTLTALLPALEKNGDFTSERCATHIHVGGMKNLGFLKNCLQLGLWFDEVFYSLAHLDSEKFRGYSNNAIYARPLINGPYFRYNRDYYQVLNYQCALGAQDLYEFFSCYGANVEDGEMTKYHPGRYFSINLYSIPRIGTIEFRHFNQSFNAQMVSAVAKLCQLFVEVAIKSRLTNLQSYTPGDVFTLQSPSYYMNKLYQFLELAETLECDYFLEKKDIKVLESIIHRYKGIGIENKEVLTHCKDFEIPSEIIESGNLKRAKNKPCVDGHTDIHNIKYSSILGD